MAAVLGVVLTFVLPMFLGWSGAHSPEELDEWMVEWVVRADGSLSPGLLDEAATMMDRHSYYFNPPDHSVSSQQRASIGWSGTVEGWRGFVSLYFPAGEVDRALCILAAESGGNPDAKNPRSSAAGLFQFLRSTWDSVPLSVSGGSYDSGAVYDPESNIRSAAWLQAAWGWSQWSPYNRGLCH